jgi:diguanylate cyclase (GGDEF)-like protein
VRRLLPADPKDRFHEDELRRTLVDDLYRRSAATVWALVPCLFLFRGIIRNAYDVSAPLRFTFWLTLALVVTRWLVVLDDRRRSPEQARPERLRYSLFHWLTVSMGAGIAACVLLAGPHLTFSQLCLVAVFLCGVDSVALGSMAASPITYVQYVNPGLLAIGWALLMRTRGGQENILLALLAFYIPVLSLMCYYAHAGVRRTILLGLELRDLALQDALTGLRNRRFLTEFMSHEAPQVVRSWNELENETARPSQSIGLLLLDLDAFKAVNDEHGHGAGDEVLRQFAVVLQDALRKPDLVVRWGGEEFVVVARDLARDAVWDLADRIRRQIEAHPFRLPSGDLIHKTCSIGFSLFPFSGKSPDLVGWEQALALADQALYQAKETGRNRVIGIAAGDAAVDKADTLVRAVNDDFGAAAARGLIRLVPGREPATVPPRG